ncbi:hypothetical protein EX30DRAFT_398987 [Ascodesmis nigricans]|uniref:Uncharacterized protein n=1 Tax=Ascodesmis nigricans TaxID=341454 RepID=A0A4S2MNM3_9PEZI|nr:hypothetical protein EX30DRAFT_398987 [Ascodesmis nigricans]
MAQSLRTTTSTSTATPTPTISTSRAMAANVSIGVNSTTLTSGHLYANSNTTHSTTPYITTTTTSVPAYSDINTPLINGYLGYSDPIPNVPLAPGPNSALGLGLGPAYGLLGVYGGYTPHIMQPQMLSGGGSDRGGLGVGMARNPYRGPSAAGYGLGGYGRYGLGSRCWGMRRNPYRGVGGGK